MMKQHLKRSSKQISRSKKTGKEVKLEVKNLTYLRDLLSMMLFHWQGIDELAPLKYEYALSLYKADTGMFAELYGLLIPEFYRRVLHAHGVSRNDFFPAHANYQLGEELFGRLAIAMMMESGATNDHTLSLSDVLGEVKYLDYTLSFADALRVLGGDQVESALFAIEAVEHVLGLQMGDDFIRRIFPNHAPRIQLHLGLQRRMELMAPTDQLRCIMELAGAAGQVGDDELQRFREALAPGGLLSQFLNRDLTQPLNPMLPPNRPKAIEE
jgi:hypothetical protein